MERKDIIFGVEKIDHKWYFHFDAETGMVNSMSVHKEDSSLEISKELAENIQKGSDNMAFYKVVFKEGRYTYINTVQTPPAIANQKIDYYTGNTDIHKIAHNDKETKIIFRHVGNKLVISATDTMKDIICSTFTDQKQKIHKFYICAKNDHSLLHKTLEINLLDLSQSEIEVNIDVAPEQYSIYCRKVFEYDYV